MKLSRFPTPLLLTGLLAACHNSDRPAATAAQVPAAPAAAETFTAGDVARTTAHDTLRVNDSLGRAAGLVRLRPSTAAAWATLRDPQALPPAFLGSAMELVGDQLPEKMPEPLPKDGQVRRQGDDLLLQPQQGPAIRLHPEQSSEDGPEGREIGYTFWGSLPAIHQWVVLVDADEGGVTRLIDQRTGRRTDLLGLPVLAPDGRHLLDVYQDVASGANPTGLALYRLDAAGLRQVWQRDLTNWGPSQARWRDARHVLLQQQHPAPTGDVAGPQPAPTYAELELPAGQ